MGSGHTKKTDRIHLKLCGKGVLQVVSVCILIKSEYTLLQAHAQLHLKSTAKVNYSYACEAT
jgi:hypothetical protein